MSELEELARRQYLLEQAVKGVKKPRLQFSSIDDGNIPEYDIDGNLKTVIGAQFDGGHGVLVTSDPTPLRPSNATVIPGPGTLTARWDGVWCDDAGTPDETIPVPTWHARVEVHASQNPAFEPDTAATLRATIETPRGGEVVLNLPEGGTWYIRFVARSQSGNAGPASDPVFGEPAPVVTDADIVPAVDARLSASGTVQIVSNDTTPPEPAGGWRAGAIWWQTAGPGPLGNTVTWHRWDGTAWVEQQIDEAFLPLVNIGTGTFGNLSGDRITLGSVPDDALSFGIDELIPNPKWMNAAYDPVYGLSKISTSTSLTGLAPALGWQYSPAPVRFGQPKVVTVSIAGTIEAEQFMPVGPAINCAGGDRFYIQVDTYSTGNPNVDTGFQLHCFDAAGVYTSAINTRVVIPTTATPDVWTPRSKVVTVPDGTAYLVPVLRKAGRTVGVAGVGMVHFGAVSLRRAMHGADESGQHMELSPAGLRLFDVEGAEVVNLTSTPPNYVSVLNGDGDTMASIGRVEIGEATGVYEGLIAGDNLTTENDPEIAGSRLLGGLTTWDSPRADPGGWLDQLARGLVAWGSVGSQNQNGQNGELGLMQLEFQQSSGRSYLIVVEPFSVDIDPGAFALNLKYTVGSGGSDPANPSFTSTLYNKVRETVTGTAEQRTLSAAWIWNAGGTGDNTVKLLLTASANTNFHFATGSDEGDVRMSVYDMGLRVNDGAVSRLLMKKWVATADPEPTPAADTKKNYTKTYFASGYRSYFESSGAFYNWNTSKMFQGNSPSVGGLQSIATFPSMTGDLSGATITSMRAYFYFEHWYYNSGGTAKIGAHGSTSLPSTFPGTYTHMTTSSSWPKPGGRWVNIPSSFWAGFKSGTYRGLTLGDTSPSTTEYGYARGSSTRIEVKYSK